MTACCISGSHKAWFIHALVQSAFVGVAVLLLHVTQRCWILSGLVCSHSCVAIPTAFQDQIKYYSVPKSPLTTP